MDDFTIDASTIQQAKNSIVINNDFDHIIAVIQDQKMSYLAFVLLILNWSWTNASDSKKVRRVFEKNELNFKYISL